MPGPDVRFAQDWTYRRRKIAKIHRLLTAKSGRRLPIRLAGFCGVELVGHFRPICVTTRNPQLRNGDDEFTHLASNFLYISLAVGMQKTRGNRVPFNTRTRFQNFASERLKQKRPKSFTEQVDPWDTMRFFAFFDRAYRRSPGYCR